MTFFGTGSKTSYLHSLFRLAPEIGVVTEHALFRKNGSDRRIFYCILSTVFEMDSSRYGLPG